MTGTMRHAGLWRARAQLVERYAQERPSTISWRVRGDRRASDLLIGVEGSARRAGSAGLALHFAREIADLNLGVAWSAILEVRLHLVVARE